ncbi:hypothetical protein HHI36_006421, partial [Cryptolaemus montrouzieri]
MAYRKIPVAIWQRCISDSKFSKYRDKKSSKILATMSGVKLGDRKSLSRLYGTYSPGRLSRLNMILSWNPFPQIIE